MEPQPRVIQRVLSPARAATRDRLITATIDLATSGGYDGVTIRAVALEAGTSVPTVYQHASSKDQLLVDALVSLGEESNRQLRARPPRGKTPAARITAVFTRIMQAAHEKPLLYQALSRAWVASAPAISGLDGALGFGPGSAAWIGESLRAGGGSGHADADIETASRILSCLFLGALIEVASGRDRDEVIELLGEAARRLLPEKTTHH